MKTLGLKIMALLLVTACSFSPDDAVIQRIKASYERNEGEEIQEGSLRVLQSRSMDDREIVLVTFQTVSHNGKILECLYSYAAHRDRIGWSPAGGGGGCGPVGGVGEPIGIGMGRNSVGARDGWSRASGFVYEADITEIIIIWEDDDRQTVPVVNGAYLALRAGSHGVREVQALDDAGEVVYRWIEEASSK